MNEIYKDIKGYEGFYQVSNLGNIKRLEHTKYNLLTKTNSVYKEHLVKKCINKKGYYQVTLCKNSKIKPINVHRLVAEAFIPNFDNLPCINHIDGNKSNNRVDNLEWCSFKYNVQHAYKNNLMLNCKKVKQYDLNGSYFKEYNSINEANKQTNINQGNISMCILGKRKSAGGYIWRVK
jgi:hypothetical protein